MATSDSLLSHFFFSLKSLVDGYKQWSSSAPNLGKGPRSSPALPGFTSLTEMGKHRSGLGSVPLPSGNSWPFPGLFKDP